MRLGTRVPYTEIKETVADYFDINDNLDQDLLEYRNDLLEIFPRRPPRARAIAARGLQSRTANAQSAARFIQQHQNIIADRIKRWIGDSDKRVISRFLRQLQALCTAEHMVVPDSLPHRKAGRADRRRDLARRRRHPPPQLVSPSPACAVWMQGSGEGKPLTGDVRGVDNQAPSRLNHRSARGWRNW